MSHEKLTIIRGDYFSQAIQFTDSEGAAINLTGKSIIFTVKYHYDNRSNDNSALISKTITSHSNPINGISTLEMTKEETDIPSGVHKWDFQIVDLSGNVESSLPADIIVINDITKS